MDGKILILASGNPGKVREIQAILAPRGIRVRPVAEVAPGFSVEEDRETFAGNAAKKALAAAAVTGAPALADDSGLCVEALGGGPGVRSARFGGPGLSDSARTRRLLEALQDAPAPRHACFRCALAAVLPAAWLTAPGPPDPEIPPDRRLVAVEGRLDGTIGFEPRGDHGFGYDPVFLPSGRGGATLAELPEEEKNLLSHRARALAALVALLGYGQ